MALKKLLKPEWAFGIPPGDPYVVEPPLVKRLVGWLSAEKPPYQWFNWLHYHTKAWIDTLEDYVTMDQSAVIASEQPIAWNTTTGTITFITDILIKFLHQGIIYTNRLGAGSSPITLTDGQALVCIPAASNLTLAADTYANIADGKYAVVNVAALNYNEKAQELILFNRAGIMLEIPPARMIINGSRVFTLGGIAAHNHSTDSEGGASLGTIANPVTLQGAPIITDFTNADHDHQDAAGGGPLDHGAALMGLGDDDHPQYVHATTARTISAQHTFNPLVVGAAFALGPNATDQLIPGLNADLVDGQHASAFAPASHTHPAMEGHIAATSGVHGVAGNVVGTTDTQTLANKTLASPVLTGAMAGSGNINLNGSIGSNGILVSQDDSFTGGGVQSGGILSKRACVGAVCHVTAAGGLTNIFQVQSVIKWAGSGRYRVEYNGPAFAHTVGPIVMPHATEESVVMSAVVEGIGTTYADVAIVDDGGIGIDADFHFVKVAR